MFENEKTVQLAKELAKALQESEIYTTYNTAREENDADVELQSAIQKFNLIQMNLENEYKKAIKDDDALELYEEQLRDEYEKIMSKPSMQRFSDAANKLQRLMTYINGIIDAGFQGKDVDSLTEEDTCTHDCSTCGGCH